jgi:hypothetical protein
MMPEDTLQIEFNAIFGDEGKITGASNLRLVGEPGVVLGPPLMVARCPPPPPKILKVTITVDSSADIKVESIESVTS